MTTQASAPPSTKTQALRSYDVADFPALTGLEEEWRFTPLKRLRGLVGGAQAATATVRHEYGDLPEGVTVGRIGADDPRVGSVLTRSTGSAPWRTAARGTRCWWRSPGTPWSARR